MVQHNTRPLRNMTRELRYLRNMRKISTDPYIEEGIWLIRGFLCCKSMQDRVVLFATIDRDFPAFQDKCPGQDKCTYTELPTSPDPLNSHFSDDKIITATVTRPLGIFVTRLSPTTTEDDLEKLMNEKNFKVINVEKLPTKFDYTSFYVKLNIGNHAISEVLNLNVWPSGILVRKYYETKQLRSSP